MHPFFTLNLTKQTFYVKNTLQRVFDVILLATLVSGVEHVGTMELLKG